MTSNEILDIALLPPVKVEVNLVEKVATIINTEPINVRRLLSAKVPKIVARYNNLQEAEVALTRLGALGLAAFLCNDNDLRKSTPIFNIHTLEFSHSAILFRDKSGQERKIESENAFLIIKGILEIQLEKEVINTKKKLNVTATILTGGIPIRKTIREKTLETSIQIENFLRIYEKQDSNLCFEIIPRSFNFSCLGKEMSPSSLANFNVLARKIREVLPEAIFDDKLKEFSRVTIPSDPSHQENLDITCRLIYKYYQITSNCRSSTWATDFDSKR